MVKIWGCYGQEFGVLFFETQCIVSFTGRDSCKKHLKDTKQDTHACMLYLEDKIAVVMTTRLDSVTPVRRLWLESELN